MKHCIYIHFYAVYSFSQSRSVDKFICLHTPVEVVFETNNDTIHFIALRTRKIFFFFLFINEVYFSEECCFPDLNDTISEKYCLAGMNHEQCHWFCLVFRPRTLSINQEIEDSHPGESSEFLSLF